MGFWHRLFGKRPINTKEALSRDQREDSQVTTVDQKNDYSSNSSKDELPDITEGFIQLIDEVRKSCSGENLWTVLGNEMETLMGPANELHLEVKSWFFQFDQSSKVISSKGLNATKELKITSSELVSTPGPQGRGPLAGVRIGFDEACRIAIDNGGIITSGGGMMGGGSCLVMLNMRNVDGKNVPMWLMPHRLEGFMSIGIRADTGKLTYILEPDKDLWTQNMPNDIKELLRQLQIPPSDEIKDISEARNGMEVQRSNLDRDIPSVSAFAGTATIVDRKSVKVKVKEIEDMKLKVWVGAGFKFVIPFSMISTIRRVKDNHEKRFTNQLQRFIIKTTTGEELEVRCSDSDKIEGAWDLGKYKTRFADIESVVFDRSQDLESVHKPVGFFGTLTDTDGTVISAFDIMYTVVVFVGREIYNYSYLPFEHEDILVGIPFDRIHTLTLSQAEEVERPHRWDQKAVIDSPDGTVLQGKIGRALCFRWRRPEFSGKTGYGDFEIDPDNLRNIVFNHDDDTIVPNRSMETDVRGDIYSGKVSISVKTWQGNHYILPKGIFLEGSLYDLQVMDGPLEFALGAGNTQIELEKIRRIQFKERICDPGGLCGSDASVLASSGEKFQMTLLRMDRLLLGPVHLKDELLSFVPSGIGWILLENVASLEFMRHE